ncbi:50S ribosomal protein L17 [Candidatus Gottesmanbacteria bacterium]|nr:50S ribosomal protein L17 [Candidatus Gottesmanbacteria bacterium]
MHHSVFGRKLSRTKNERRRLLQSLARELIRRGSVRTIYARAKAVQPLVEKLVSHAKKASSSKVHFMQIRKILADKATEKFLLADALTRFAARTSGFTRIVKLGPRTGDAAEEVMLQFVDDLPAGRQERAVAEVVKAPEPIKEKEPVAKKRSASAKATAGRRGRPKKSP